MFALNSFPASYLTLVDGAVLLLLRRGGEVKDETQRIRYA